MSLLLASWQNLEGLYLIDLIPYSALLAFIMFVLGSCFGSFANAAAMRLVRDESPIFPASRCRDCDTPLRWHDNLPLLGWLKSGGKTACCQRPLSPRYILVEGAMGALFCFYFFTLPALPALTLALAAVIMMVALLTDSEAMVLHPPSLLAGALLGIAASLGVPGWPVTPTESAAGAILGASIVMIINLSYRLLRGQNGFGTGDVWLMGMIAGIFGIGAGITIFFVATFVGATAGIALILLKKADSATKLPFGLFLSVVFLLYPALNMLLI